jgi:hypothetical protein
MFRHVKLPPSVTLLALVSLVCAAGISCKGQTPPVPPAPAASVKLVRVVTEKGLAAPYIKLNDKMLSLDEEVPVKGTATIAIGVPACAGPEGGTVDCPKTVGPVLGLAGQIYVFRATSRKDAEAKARQSGVPESETSKVFPSSDRDPVVEVEVPPAPEGCGRLAAIEVAIDAGLNAVTAKTPPALVVGFEGASSRTELPTGELTAKRNPEDPEAFHRLTVHFDIPAGSLKQPMPKLGLYVPAAGDFAVYVRRFEVKAVYAR